MSTLTKICCLTLLFCHLITRSAWAQPSVGDSAAPLPNLPADLLPAYDTALSLYHSYLTPETGLYRGIEYGAYDIHLRSGNPYFGDKRRRPGTIVYDSVLYGHLMLLYDEVKDIVILNDPSNIFKIDLFPDLIDRFTIEDHRFIRLTDSLNPNQPRNGYYEVLYQGKRMTLLKKEKKVIQEDLQSSNVAEYFIEGADTSYYLVKKGVYFPVHNTKTLLRALKDKSKDTKKFIRSNGLSMHKDREYTLLKVAAWYDTASPQ